MSSLEGGDEDEQGWLLDGGGIDDSSDAGGGTKDRRRRRPGWEDDDDGRGDGDSDGSDLMPIRVRCMDGRTHTVAVPPSCLVSELKLQLQRGPMPESRGKVIRLMHSGRILRDGEVLRDAGVEVNHCIHAVVTTAPAPTAAAAPGAALAAVLRREGGDGADGDGGAGAVAGAGDGNAGVGRVDGGEGGRYTGFDVLMGLGFGVDDVAAIRTMYAEDVAQLFDQVPPHDGEDAIAHTRRVEEVWMAHQGPDSEFALNLRARLEGLPGEEAQRLMRAMWRHREEVGDDDDDGATTSPGDRPFGQFVWGFLLGFSLGFFTLFWAAHRFVPRTQKFGILAGVTLNILLTAASKRNTVADDAVTLEDGGTGDDLEASIAAAAGSDVAAAAIPPSSRPT